MAYQPKSYKKFVATAATATLVASALVPTASAASFSDVNSNYKVAVDYLVANKIAQGTSDTTFGTTASITRGDAAVMIANALKLNTSSAPDAGFTDLNTRVAGAVNALAAAKIIGGKSATKFAPDDKITRQEMAKVVSLAYELDNAGTNNKFVDVNSNWDSYVDALVKHEVTLGKTPTTFGATQNVTRGEFALFVYRAETLVPATPEVVSVSAINAKQVEVKFNKAVVASSVVDTDGTLKTGVIAFSTISGTSATLTDSSVASLSADGKVLTVSTASGTLNGEYVLKTVEDTIKDKEGNFAPVFTSAVFKVSDVVAPTIKSVEKLDASNVRVYFSEPLSSAGNWTFKLADGSTATVSTNSFTNIAKGYVDLTIDAGVAAGKEITATVIGAADFANNLISPNPVTFNFSKGALDGTKPSVSSLTPLSLTKFEVKFSEEVQGFNGADVVLNGSALNDVSANLPALEAGEAKVTQDSTDKTKFTVELGTAVTGGLNTVGIAAAGVTDLSGETNNAFSRVVDFKVDTVAPKLVTSEIKTDAGTEYLYLTFDESVTAGTLTSLAATQVKNFVTVAGTINLTDLTAVANSDDKQYRVALNSSNTKFTPTSGSAAAIADGATYTVTLTGAFTDKSTNPLGSTSITFTRGADTDTTKPAIVKTVDGGETSPNVASNGIHVIDNDTFQVTFDKAVDGASATNKANYAVNGATVKSATLKPGNLVEVTFEANTISIDGLRNVTVSGVKSSAGVLMSAYTTSEYFVENVKPVVSSASLIAQNKVKVVFSEGVNVSDFTKTDIDVFAGTSQLPEAGSFAVAPEAASPGTHETAFIITLDANLSAAQYAEVLTVKVVHDASIITDAKGNEVVTGTYTIAK